MNQRKRKKDKQECITTKQQTIIGPTKQQPFPAPTRLQANAIRFTAKSFIPYAADALCYCILHIEHKTKLCH